MELSTAEDLAIFVEELRRESDRGLALVTTALIDNLLRDTLVSFFCKSQSNEYLLDNGNAPLGSLSARLHTSRALGLIDEFEFTEINLLRKVRNKFAHAKHGLNFSNEIVRGFCSSLQSDLPEGVHFPTNEPRFRFTNASVCIVLRLYHRPAWVRLERRNPKVWVTDEQVRWRSFDEEKPPHGTHFIGIGYSSKRPK